MGQTPSMKAAEGVIHDLTDRLEKAEAERDRYREAAEAALVAFDEHPAVFEPHCAALRRLRDALGDS